VEAHSSAGDVPFVHDEFGAVPGYLAEVPSATPRCNSAMGLLVSGTVRVLIVLDNARDDQQVRPLLPASPWRGRRQGAADGS
jgi:hypothetical protein